MRSGLWAAIIFFYIPIAIFVLAFKPLGEIGWWNFLISIPTMVLTVAIGEIFDRR